MSNVFTQKNNQFRHYKRQYISQSLLATLVVFLLLMSLHFLTNELVIASIASTTFIIFCTPHYPLTKARYILGGYLIGISMGFLGYLLHVEIEQNMAFLNDYQYELVGALVVGACAFLMVLFRLAHPPAASVALALVIFPWTAYTIIGTFIAVGGLMITHAILGKRLINLV